MVWHLCSFYKILCGRNFCVWKVRKLKFTGQLQMASLSLYRQFKTNLMSNRKVIELLLQLKSAKDHGKNYITVKPHLVRHLLRNRRLAEKEVFSSHTIGFQLWKMKTYSMNFTGTYVGDYQEINLKHRRISRKVFLFQLETNIMEKSHLFFNALQV